MRIVVVGGTGFIGARVVGLLADAFQFPTRFEDWLHQTS
jgi:uncharacterized protein YbjT (DUF2867 family)